MEIKYSRKRKLRAYSAPKPPTLGSRCDEPDLAQVALPSSRFLLFVFPVSLTLGFRMVYYFTSTVVDPPAYVYVGKDKFESA